MRFLYTAKSCFLCSWSFLAVFQVSEVCRKVGESGTIHFHQFVSKSDFIATSYGQNIDRKLTSIEINKYRIEVRAYSKTLDNRRGA